MKTEQEIRAYLNALLKGAHSPCECSTPEARARCAAMKSAMMETAKIVHWVLGENEMVDMYIKDMIREFAKYPDVPVSKPKPMTAGKKYRVVVAKFKSPIRKIIGKEERSTQAKARKRATLIQFLKENEVPLVYQPGVRPPLGVLVHSAKKVAAGKPVAIVDLRPLMSGNN